MRNDPALGPVLAFGLGGTLAEISHDVVLRSLPLRAGEAASMIGETRIASRLPPGARGSDEGDVAASVKALEALSDFAMLNTDWIDEIDGNPIKVRPVGQGCVAIDAVIVPRAG